MDERHQPDRARGAEDPAVPALVEAQLESARAEVFRAYVRARANARALDPEDGDDRGDRPRRGS